MAISRHRKKQGDDSAWVAILMGLLGAAFWAIDLMLCSIYFWRAGWLGGWMVALIILVLCALSPVLGILQRDRLAVYVLPLLLAFLDHDDAEIFDASERPPASHGLSQVLAFLVLFFSVLAACIVSIWAFLACLAAMVAYVFMVRQLAGRV